MRVQAMWNNVKCVNPEGELCFPVWKCVCANTLMRNWKEWKGVWSNAKFWDSQSSVEDSSLLGYDAVSIGTQLHFREACCLHLHLFLDHLELKGRQQIHPKHPVYQLTLQHIAEDLNLQCRVTFGAFCLELLLYCWTITRVQIGLNGLKTGWSLFSKQIQNTDVP